MGSTEGRVNERSVREVTLSGFEMAKTPVTQAQWEAVMGTNPSVSDRGMGPSHPVNRVSWYDAIANGYRLPTEAEWEYAARGAMRAEGTSMRGATMWGRLRGTAGTAIGARIR